MVANKVDGQNLFDARGEKWKNLFGAKWQLRNNLFGSQRVNKESKSVHQINDELFQFAVHIDEDSATAKPISLRVLSWTPPLPISRDNLSQLIII